MTFLHEFTLLYQDIAFTCNPYDGIVVDNDLCKACFKLALECYIKQDGEGHELARRAFFDCIKVSQTVAPEAVSVGVEPNTVVNTEVTTDSTEVVKRKLSGFELALISYFKVSLIKNIRSVGMFENIMLYDTSRILLDPYLYDHNHVVKLFPHTFFLPDMVRDVYYGRAHGVSQLSILRKLYISNGILFPTLSPDDIYRLLASAPSEGFLRENTPELLQFRRPGVGPMQIMQELTGRTAVSWSLAKVLYTSPQLSIGGGANFIFLLNGKYGAAVYLVFIY